MTKMVYKIEREYYSGKDYIDHVSRFHDVLPYVENKDINSYQSINDLHIATKQAELKKFQKQEQKDAEKNTIKLINNEDFLLIKPLTYASSCMYGGGTKWCTASKETDHNFKLISSQNYLYYLIDKHKKQDHPLYKIAITVYRTGDNKIRMWNAPDKELREDIKDILPMYIYNIIMADVKGSELNGIDLANYVYKNFPKINLPSWEIFKDLSGSIGWFHRGDYYGYKDFTIFATPYWDGMNQLPIDISFVDPETGVFIHGDRELFASIPLTEKDKQLILSNFDEWVDEFYIPNVLKIVKSMMDFYIKKKG